MWAYIFRKLIYNIPIYLGIILLMMAALRVNDPIWAYLGKYANQERYDAFAHQTGLDQPFVVQYASFLKDVFQLNFSTESWDKPGVEVGAILKRAIVPSRACSGHHQCYFHLHRAARIVLSRKQNRPGPGDSRCSRNEHQFPCLHYYRTILRRLLAESEDGDGALCDRRLRTWTVELAALLPSTCIDQCDCRDGLRYSILSGRHGGGMYPGLYHHRPGKRSVP